MALAAGKGQKHVCANHPKYQALFVAGCSANGGQVFHPKTFEQETLVFVETPLLPLLPAIWEQ
jgi:hypothetical protein